jgi:hypothetical protein
VPPEPGASQAPLIVSTLLGHAQVEMGLLCLGSLLACSRRRIALRIHDDGSLDAADLDRLAAGLGSPAVVPRRQADQRAEQALAARPATRAFRAANALALKLVDAPLWADGEELRYCDADVLFLRPFARLFELPPAAGALFMRDPQNAYSVRSWHLLREPRLRLAAHVNSGLIVCGVRHLDLDLLEWYLARPEYRFAPVWIEQTCWALLGQAAGCHLLDPRAIAIPTADRQPSRRHVALHFVSPVRGLLPAYARRLAAAQAAGDAAAGRTTPAAVAAAAVDVGTRPARRLTARALAASELVRRLRRLGS